MGYNLTKLKDGLLFYFDVVKDHARYNLDTIIQTCIDKNMSQEKMIEHINNYNAIIGQEPNVPINKTLINDTFKNDSQGYFEYNTLSVHVVFEDNNESSKLKVVMERTGILSDPYIPLKNLANCLRERAAGISSDRLELKLKNLS